MTVATPSSPPQELADLLTAGRLAPYLTECGGDTAKALELYSWNVAISAACLEVIAYVEVFLRNAIDRELSQLANETERRIPWFMVPTVTGESHTQIARIIEDTRSRLRGIGEHRDSRDQIIAGLSFGFWTELFGSKHEALWRSALSNALPGTPSGKRKDVTVKLQRLRIFRNRLAHHDSLLSQDILFQLDEMLAIAEWIHPAARTWLDSVQRVGAVYKQRPVTPIDTLVVPARDAWALYQTNRVYICPAGRNFRPSKYMAFYTDKEIKPDVARILHRRDNIPWTATESTRLAALTGDEHRNDRKIAALITYGLGNGWSAGRLQVFLLSSPGDPHHIGLNAPVPHRPSGPGRAFVQRHRYVSHHTLRSARDTSEVR